MANDLIDIGKILLPEDEVIFKIVEYYSFMNEKRTEFMRMNINDFFAESFIAEIRKMNSSPRSQNNQRSDSPVTLRNFTENQESLFVPKLKGT